MRKDIFECTFVGTPSAPALSASPEKIGLRSIRICQPERRFYAVLRSFFAADRLLLEWTLQSHGRLECQFEITYDDGCRLEGCYRFVRTGSKRPGLSRQVRALARELGQMTFIGQESSRGCLLQAFLERYETDDMCVQ